MKTSAIYLTMISFHFIYVFFSFLIYMYCVLHIHRIYEYRISNLQVSNLKVQLHSPSSKSADFKPQRKHISAADFLIFSSFICHLCTSYIIKCCIAFIDNLFHRALHLLLLSFML